jgi:CubicO group peptidase (beta-lactamase class C family)
LIKPGLPGKSTVNGNSDWKQLMETVEVQIANGTVNGRLEPGFKPVLDAFCQNFEAHGDIGAACAVYHRGYCVVDLWGGLADATEQLPWQENTTALVFSAAKGPTATCIHRLVEQGALDIDVPIGEYWPEFACNGKEGISTRMVLSHRAGLAAVDGDLSLPEVLAWHPVIEAIE